MTKVDTRRTRRQFVALSTASIVAAFHSTSGARAQAPAGDDGTLRSEFLFDLTLAAQPPSIVGFPGGDRAIVAVTGGSFQGPRLKGTIAASGGDWIVDRPDGSRLLDVRIVMTTDDLQKIFVTWRGIAYSSGGALFARIVPMFETGSAKYSWLNRVVSVGVYRPAAAEIKYRVYQIL